MKNNKIINKVFDIDKYKGEYLDCEIIFCDKRCKFKLKEIHIDYFKILILCFANYFKDIEHIIINNKKYEGIIQ